MTPMISIYSSDTSPPPPKKKKKLNILDLGTTTYIPLQFEELPSQKITSNKKNTLENEHAVVNHNAPLEVYPSSHHHASRKLMEKVARLYPKKIEVCFKCIFLFNYIGDFLGSKDFQKSRPVKPLHMGVSKNRGGPPKSSICS